MADRPTDRFCPYCGHTNGSQYRFCEACHRELPSGPSPSVAGEGARPRRRARRWLWATVVLVIAAGIVLAAFLVPIHSTFSLSVVSQGLSPSVVYKTFPANAAITFSWNTSDGGSVSFSLVDSEGHTLAHSSAASGQFSFTADGGSYGFQSYSWLYEVVNVHGQYDAPALP
ncbi:MAG: zinc ribbon domain-containing protein [Thermoplasmata archaeon]|nr:zinc ribbon domain-containing protein [Thermoplasmata archaeon]MCI4355787.1 zinc ribbon domain-containing protein [Thermoplasmata archaeon]